MLIIDPVGKCVKLAIIFTFYTFLYMIFYYLNCQIIVNHLLCNIIILIVIRKLLYYRALVVRSQIKEVLLFSLDILNRKDIKYWLDFGTLLGYFREKSIILYDPDGDITIDFQYGEYAFECFKKECKKNKNFIFEARDNGKGAKWFRIYNSKKNIFSRNRHIDFYCVDKIKDDIMLLSSKNEGDHIPKDLIYPLKKSTFYGKNILVPEKEISVLKYRYGEDFMIPIHMYKGRANGKYKNLIKLILRNVTLFFYKE